jgi:hypothetical protein
MPTSSSWRRGKAIVEGKHALRDRYGATFAKDRARIAERRTEGDALGGLLLM